MALVGRFIQARNYTKGRETRIDVVVLHTMEAPEKPDTAEAIARYFATTTRDASAHYCVDSNSIVQCVRDEDVAWAAPGANSDGIQIEHAGYARQTRGDWEDDFSKGMLELSARLAAEKCREYRIPVVWLYPADLRAGRRGITSHDNVSKAFGRSTHYDPGKGFPVQRYLRMVARHLGDGGGDFPPVKDEETTVKQGDDSWLVKKAQKRLKVLGFNPGLVDGVFGAKTAEAVRQFQRSRDLEDDGVVGAMTWRALRAARPEE